MAVATTTLGVVLCCVTCFAASRAASPLPDDDDNAYTSVANYEHTKNLVSSSPRSSIARPLTWTATTRDSRKNRSHSAENSFRPAQVAPQGSSHFEYGKRGTGFSSRHSLPRKVARGDPYLMNGSPLQRAVAFSPSLRRAADVLRPVIQSLHKSGSLHQKERFPDAAAALSTQWQDILEDASGDASKGARRARYDWWRTTRAPTRPPRILYRPPVKFRSASEVFLFLGIMAGVIVVGSCCAYCVFRCILRCAQKDALATRSLSFDGPPPHRSQPRPGRTQPSTFAARMRATLGGGPRPPVQLMDSVRITSGAAPGRMGYSDLDAEDSGRFVEFLNPLTVSEDPGRGAASRAGADTGTAWRPASGGDEPPAYAEVATADRASQSEGGTGSRRYEAVTLRPEEPPSYDVAHVGDGPA